MTRKRTYDPLETLRRKAGMGERLSVKDSEYASYVGASFQTASKMARIDTMLKHGLIPEQLILFVKLYRSYLDQQRKAFFVTIDTDVITKLGILLGLKDDRISAT